MLKNFEELGITIDYNQNIKFMKVPVMGSPEFIQKYIDEKIEELETVLDALTKLPNPHVAYYLLRQAGGVCRVLFLMRTTPSEMLQDLFDRFDKKHKSVLEHLVGKEFDTIQWSKAQLPIKLGGCEIRGAACLAD